MVLHAAAVLTIKSIELFNNTILAELASIQQFVTQPSGTHADPPSVQLCDDTIIRVRVLRPRSGDSHLHLRLTDGDLEGILHNVGVGDAPHSAAQ